MMDAVEVKATWRAMPTIHRAGTLQMKEQEDAAKWEALKKRKRK